MVMSPRIVTEQGNKAKMTEGEKERGGRGNKRSCQEAFNKGVATSQSYKEKKKKQTETNSKMG
jgi:hypothetical protein